MKTDVLLMARKEVLSEFLDRSDEEYEAAEKAVDLFLDFLEKQNIREVIVTSTGVVELEEITNTQDDNWPDGEEEVR